LEGRGHWLFISPTVTVNPLLPAWQCWNLTPPDSTSLSTVSAVLAYLSIYINNSSQLRNQDQRQPKTLPPHTKKNGGQQQLRPNWTLLSPMGGLFNSSTFHTTVPSIVFGYLPCLLEVVDESRNMQETSQGFGLR